MEWGYESDPADFGSSLFDEPALFSGVATLTVSALAPDVDQEGRGFEAATDEALALTGPAARPEPQSGLPPRPTRQPRAARQSADALHAPGPATRRPVVSMPPPLQPPPHLTGPIPAPVAPPAASSLVANRQPARRQQATRAVQPDRASSMVAVNADRAAAANARQRAQWQAAAARRDAAQAAAKTDGSGDDILAVLNRSLQEQDKRSGAPNRKKNSASGYVGIMIFLGYLSFWVPALSAIVIAISLVVTFTLGTKMAKGQGKVGSGKSLALAICCLLAAIVGTSLRNLG